MNVNVNTNYQDEIFRLEIENTQLRKRLAIMQAALEQGIRLANHYLARHTEKHVLPCDWFDEAKIAMVAALDGKEPGRKGEGEKE